MGYFPNQRLCGFTETPVERINRGRFVFNKKLFIAYPINSQDFVAVDLDCSASQEADTASGGA